jgi:hypothetical protein
MFFLLTLMLSMYDVDIYDTSPSHRESCDSNLRVSSWPIETRAKRAKHAEKREYEVRRSEYPRSPSAKLFTKPKPGVTKPSLKKTTRNKKFSHEHFP